MWIAYYSFRIGAAGRLHRSYIRPEFTDGKHTPNTAKYATRFPTREYAELSCKHLGLAYPFTFKQVVR